MISIKELQEFLGVTADGSWGPKSQAALQAVLHPSAPEVIAESAPVDNGVAPQWPREADAASFYGHSDGSSGWESAHLVTIVPPYPMFMDSQVISKIRCHKRVAESLLRILTKIRALYPDNAALHATGLDQYDGCYNFRPVRGSTSRLSMHSYGAAIDFDSEHNPLGATHGRMPREVVALFKAEGWRWGGDYQNRKDWMHFEACR